MLVAQRGTSGTIPAGTSGYTADGWIVGAAGAAGIWARGVGSTGGNGTLAGALEIAGGAGTSDTFVRQRIESTVSVAMAAQTVTFQAQVYNPTGQPLTPTLTVRHPTAYDTWTSSVTDLAAVPLQTIAPNRWGQVAYVFTANFGVYLGMEVTVDVGSALASPGQLYFTGADLRVTPGATSGQATTVPALETRPPAVEATICKRYYNASTEQYGWQGNVVNGGGYFVSVHLDTPMRTTPAITVTPQVQAGFPAAYANFQGVGPTGFSVQYVANATYNAAFYWFTWTASADL